ncbi:MAG: HAD-IIB family hydrolase [Candidatus Aminicenantes bacterium]
MKIIYTDLDGTLLHSETYSFQDAEQGLTLIRKEKIPLVICTSKTRAEIEEWRERLQNHHPFVSENGGGIFIPRGYFDFDLDYDQKSRHYVVIKLGADYKRLVEVLEKVKKDYPVQGFHQMRAEEVAEDAGMPLEQAKKAKQRDFDEPFKILDEKYKQDILRMIQRNGLNCTAGSRYYHLMGKSDKGKAVKILIGLFRRQHGHITTIGIGDSENDFPMLEAVDHPYLVMRGKGSYASTRFGMAEGVGPKGWNKVILKEL